MTLGCEGSRLITLNRIGKVRKTKSTPRALSPNEIEALRDDMKESSVWAKAELKRRRAAKNQKKFCAWYR